MVPRHKSNSLSSRRTQVVVVAYIHKRHESTKHSIIHRRKVNANNKSRKQCYLLKDVEVCNVASKKLKYLTLDYIEKTLLYVMGETMNAMAFKIHRILKVFAVSESVMVTYGRVSGGKNVIFSNGPRVNSEYPNPFK